MRFAVGLPQIGSDAVRVLDAARQAEEAGAWGVWLFDNLSALKNPSAPVLDGWSLLPAVGSATRRVRVISLVTRAGLRPAGLVVRMAAVAQAASAGRFVLGLGAGDAASRREQRRFGVEPAADLEQTLARLRCETLPVRPQTPPYPVWIGGTSERLRSLAARHADAWHGWGLSPAEFAAAAARVRESAGRSIQCWWGGYWRPGLHASYAGAADGITWMLASARDREQRTAMLEEVASAQAGGR